MECSDPWSVERNYYHNNLIWKCLVLLGTVPREDLDENLRLIQSMLDERKRSNNEHMEDVDTKFHRFIDDLKAITENEAHTEGNYIILETAMAEMYFQLLKTSLASDTDTITNLEKDREGKVSQDTTDMADKDDIQILQMYDEMEEPAQHSHAVKFHLDETKLSKNFDGAAIYIWDTVNYMLCVNLVVDEVEEHDEMDEVFNYFYEQYQEDRLLREMQEYSSKRVCDFKGDGNSLSIHIDQDQDWCWWEVKITFKSFDLMLAVDLLYKSIEIHDSIIAEMKSKME